MATQYLHPGYRPVDEGGGDVAPELPSNEVVGQASWRTISWGGFQYVYTWHEKFDEFVAAGFQGCTSVNPSRDLVAQVEGNGQLPTDTANRAGSSYDWQRAQEGRAVSAINGVATGRGAYVYRRDWNPDWEPYIPITTTREVKDDVYPPMWDWYDDDIWADAVDYFALVAHDLRDVLGGSGIGFDTEFMNWEDGPTAGHTLAEEGAKVFERAYACGEAFFTTFPDGKIFTYDFRHSGGYNQWLTGWYWSGTTAPTRADVEIKLAWHLGWVKAMCDFGSSESRHMTMDAGFYVWGEYGMGTSADARKAKLKMNCERGMAVMSQEWPYGIGAESWSKGCDRILFIPSSWADTAADKTAQTTASTWATQVAIDRECSMSEFRCVYHGAGSGAAGGIGGTPDGQWYATQGGSGTKYSHLTTHLAGNQAGSSQTAISTSVPTITNLSWDGSTLTCRAAHAYGVWHVRVFDGPDFDLENPEASYLGAAQMTWVHPSLPDYLGTTGDQGGDASASFPTGARVADSYQSCSFDTDDATGDWLVVKAVSAKLDVVWARVQRS